MLPLLLIPSQGWSSHAGYDSVVGGARIHEAMDDIKSIYGIAEVTDAYNNNDRGAALNSDNGNKDWRSFGFWAVSTFGRDVAEHQNGFNYNAYLFGIKDMQYTKSLKIGERNGVVNSKYEDGVLLVQVIWGNPSLFAYFGGNVEAKNFPSLTKEQKDVMVANAQSKAIAYANMLEKALVQNAAYDDAPEMSDGSIKVVEIVGEVEYKEPDKDFVPLTVGTVLKQGWYVATGFESEVVLDFGYAELTVPQLTQLRIDEFTSKENIKKTQMYLFVGAIAAKVKHTDAIRSDFSVTTPTANSSIRGSEMVVKYDENTRITTVYVTEDQAYVKGVSDEVIIVGENQKTVVNGDGSVSEPESFTAAELPFTQRPGPATEPKADQMNQVSEVGNQIVQTSGDAIQKVEQTVQSGKNCLIATAAFGSELTPQVQFLRNFRDRQIMSTLAGSSFMNVFNAWYYSFSPYVANYEREQAWFQNTVRMIIYPLLGILQVSQLGYVHMEGEYGAVVSGFVASSFIGALYFWPFALSISRIRSARFNYRLALFAIAIASLSVITSILTGNTLALMTSTSVFVLTILSISAVLSAKVIAMLMSRFRFEIKSWQ
jgi:peptide/nickel transport system substrate-binding protein